MSPPALDTLDYQSEDDLDLIAALEGEFGISFADAELSSVETVGQMHALLVSKVLGDRVLTGKCASQMAFYRIRRALGAHRPDLTIKPDTPLAELIEGYPSRFFSRLRKISGLTLPLLDPDRAYLIAGIAVPLSIIYAVVASIARSQLDPVPLAAAGLLLILMQYLPGRLPAHLRTVGDLARASGALSHATLDSARLDAKVLWQVLVERACSSLARRPTIVGPTTTFFRKRPA